MIDPNISLAFSMHSNKGVYALLLGSGVSRSANIPTGHEIMLDIIRRIAALEQENCDPDPEKWYIDKHKEKPDYSNLIEKIVKTDSERSNYLKQDIEPTEDEKSRGEKIPKPAHEAIAKLVSNGYVRIIITTNFDRLIETALIKEGVTPYVIKTSDEVKGVLPLAHIPCLVLKVNGDYLDTRIKNTFNELNKYDEPLEELLDQIFNEYGLLVCGWSAEYDIALCYAIKRCKTYRFSTYWCHKGEIISKAEDIISNRKAEKIQIDNADVFFRDLWEKISVLEKYDQPHPISIKVSINRLKNYIQENKLIDFSDLLHDETERTYESISKIVPNSFSNKQAEYPKSFYYSMECLLHLFINGCYWGNKYHIKYLVNNFERITNPISGSKALKYFPKPYYYPGLLLFYCGGIASIASEKYDILTALFNASIREMPHNVKPAYWGLATYRVIENNESGKFTEKENYCSPVSEFLFEILREPFKELIPDDLTWDQCFNRFEYFLNLKQFNNPKNSSKNVQFGRFACTDEGIDIDPATVRDIYDESAKFSDKWPPLKAGLWGISKWEDFSNLKLSLDEKIKEYRRINGII